MIGRLTGRADPGGDDWALIDVAGVGYVVHASVRTLQRLSPGEVASVLIETWVREDRITLYGFLDAGEKQWFRWLTAIQGVGPRVALAILSVMAPDELLQAVLAEDRKAMTRADGVGPRLAARVVGELKGKAATGGLELAAAETAGRSRSVSATGPDRDRSDRDRNADDAVSALVNLGYGRTEAWTSVQRARSVLGDDAELDALIREGLKDLAA